MVLRYELSANAWVCDINGGQQKINLTRITLRSVFPSVMSSGVCKQQFFCVKEMSAILGHVSGRFCCTLDHIKGVTIILKDMCPRK